MSDPVVHIQDAVVSYQDHVALDGVSLAVCSGDFVGIIGPNGAGKTTLLTVINALASRVRGQVRVLGVEPYGGRSRRLGHWLRKRIGYVAQVERIDPRLPITVRETAAVGCYGRLGWLRRPGSREWRRVDEALEQVGASHLGQRPIGHLSGGEYQRVAIARVLVQQPDIFLFDEPTASIDPQAQREILDLIQRIHAQQGTTALYVTHDLATLPNACRHLVLMRKGCIWREGPREEMLKEKLLKQLYDGGGIAV